MKYYSAIIKEQNNAICSNMDATTVYHTNKKYLISEISQKEKDKYHMIPLTYGIYPMTQMNLSMKQKWNHRHREKTSSCQGGGTWGRNGV